MARRIVRWGCFGGRRLRSRNEMGTLGMWNDCINEQGGKDQNLALILKDFVHYGQRNLSPLLRPCETITSP